MVLSARSSIWLDSSPQPVDLGRGLAGDRGGAELVARAARALGVAADRNALDSRQVLVEPAAALRQRLRVRADAHDALERIHAPHQAVVDPQLDLAADLQRAGDEPIERVGDRALGGILDRDHAEVGVARLDFLEHLVAGAERQRAHRMPEVLEHGRLGVGALGTEERDLERLLLREAGRHDLAEQPRNLLVAQRPAVALQRRPQHLRLAVRAIEIDRVAGGVLRDADLLGEARAAIDELLQLLVERVDFGAQRGERRLVGGRGRAPPRALAACGCHR